MEIATSRESCCDDDRTPEEISPEVISSFDLELSGILSNVTGKFPIEQLEVRKWKLFGVDAPPVKFNRRVTTIVGPIGSGKSSILEAIFMTLAVSENQNLSSLIATLPENQDKVSFKASGQSNGDRVWSRELVRPGNNPKASMSLEDSKGEMPSVFYVPQDHGLKLPFRYARISWCFTFEKLQAGEYHDIVGKSEKLRDTIDMFCGVKFQAVEKRSSNVARGLFQLTRSGQKDFGAENLSGGQVDAILCLLALSEANAVSTFKSCVVLLDEPGQNLGAHERELLRREIYKSPCQVILVTHHIEMLDRRHLPNGLIRFLVPSDATWRKKEACISNYINGEQLLEILGTDDKDRFQKFIRLPENLSIFFADAVLLVEGVTDVRTLKALDEVWCGEGRRWNGLACLILSTGGHDCLPLWKIFFRLRVILKMRVFCLLDLDVLWTSRKQENTEEKKEKNALGGAVYYFIQCGRSGYWDELLEVVMEEHNIEVKSGPEKWTSALALLGDKYPPLIEAANFLEKFFKKRPLPEILPPEYLNGVIKALNFLLLSNSSFPAFVWPPRVADIEGILLDKTWTTNWLLVDEFREPFLLKDLRRMDLYTARDHCQVQLASDLFNFVQSSLLHAENPAREQHLQKLFDAGPNDAKKISFSSRSEDLKEWYSLVTATDFNGLVGLHSQSSHPLRVAYCMGTEVFTDVSAKQKTLIAEALERLRQFRIDSKGKKKTKDSSFLNVPSLELQRKEERKSSLSKNRPLAKKATSGDLLERFRDCMNTSNFQGALKLLRDGKLEATLKEVAKNPLLEMKTRLNADNYHGVLELLNQDEFYVSLLRASNSQLEKEGIDFDLQIETIVQSSSSGDLSTQWKFCLVRDREIHPACALIWRLKWL